MPSYRCLTPSKFRLRRHRFANIGSGSFQPFAIQEHGTVWGWGSDLYGEGGQESGHIDKIGDGFSIPAVPPPLTSKLDDFFDGAIMPAGNAES